MRHVKAPPWKKTIILYNQGLSKNRLTQIKHANFKK